MRSCIALAAICFIAGCATVGSERVEQLRPDAKIVPLSLMGDTLAIRHVGTMVFENARGDVAVPTWQIDRYTETLVARLLASNPKVNIATANTEGARKAAGKTSTDFWTSQVKLEGGLDSVTNLAKETGADYVLIIAQSPIGDPFFRTNQSFSGYGIYQRHFLNQQNGINFVTMRAALLDGKTGAEVARTQTFASSSRAQSYWMARDSLKLTADNENSTRASVEQLIENVMRKCLAELKLH